ncbi:ChrR family anti-sigma-E factor [Tropicimonas isoalkanivorans]|uniref:Anti-ECFsigma factor, ChrR n=1 Tax=Tropicimonas isoalkanivorans TaxID=441112 RepID=A0A1I1NVF7_9RHOB|nr:ChrR family anti-sigma-E factor [Tropicimonas isoalkanivorans]SFD01312.1 anti-ECFsigma factor, ChrR [Tropicimonas isoalkanivorans]
MSVRHRIPDEILAEYAAGDLAEAFGLVVASHVSLCTESRERLEEIEAVGGAILEDVEAEPMGAGSLEATLAKIADGPPPEAPLTFSSTDAGTYILPKPIRDYIGGDVESVKWRSVGMGVKQAILPTSPEATARLLYIPAGCEMPDHGHRGMEMTVVLQGAFLDGEDRFGRGDVEVADEDLAHMPVADVGEDCICLAAADAPLRFSGLLPRLFQPFLKI